MSFETEFLPMMRDTIQVSHWDGVSHDENGKPSNHAAAVPYRCRIAGKAIALRRTSDEQEAIIYDIWLYNHNSAHFCQEDLVIFPVTHQFIQRPPQVFTVGTFGDLDGQHHVKLQCGWTYHRQGQ